MITSAAEFVRLRCSDVPEEYFRAAHEDAPLAVWHEVLSCFPEMRKWVIHNETVPMEILEGLARDGDHDIRARVASKRKLSHALFESLSRDPHEAVRQRVAYNKKAPREILERLALDESPFVREPALSRLR